MLVLDGIRVSDREYNCLLVLKKNPATRFKASDIRKLAGELETYDSAINAALYRAAKKRLLKRIVTRPNPLKPYVKRVYYQWRTL